jgi:hypothetical protein
MKTKVCYFCNSTLNGDGYCRACKDKYNLDYVYTRYFDRKNNDDYKLYYSGIGLYINEIYYHVELKFIDWDTYTPINETNIYVNHKLILTLPGYPFTPANVKDKLKKYLLFS